MSICINVIMILLFETGVVIVTRVQCKLLHNVCSSIKWLLFSNCLCCDLNVDDCLQGISAWEVARAPGPTTLWREWYQGLRIRALFWLYWRQPNQCWSSGDGPANPKGALITWNISFYLTLPYVSFFHSLLHPNNWSLYSSKHTCLKCRACKFSLCSCFLLAVWWTQ